MREIAYHLDSGHSDKTTHRTNLFRQALGGISSPEPNYEVISFPVCWFPEPDQATASPSPVTPAQRRDNKQYPRNEVVRFHSSGLSDVESQARTGPPSTHRALALVLVGVPMFEEFPKLVMLSP